MGSSVFSPTRCSRAHDRVDVVSLGTDDDAGLVVIGDDGRRLALGELLDGDHDDDGREDAESSNPVVPTSPNDVLSLTLCNGTPSNADVEQGAKHPMQLLDSSIYLILRWASSRSLLYGVVYTPCASGDDAQRGQMTPPMVAKSSVSAGWSREGGGVRYPLRCSYP